MTELVLVLLATRNRRKQLERALDSLRVQSYSALEILIMDDASTDDTPEFLNRTTELEPRLRWFRREQSQGLASALNALIAQSRGTWLARMDDDDLAHPRRIERQLTFMRAQRLDVCGTWYCRVAGWFKSIARPPVSMSSFGCNWICRYTASPDQPFPCIDQVDVESVWLELQCALAPLETSCNFFCPQ